MDRKEKSQEQLSALAVHLNANRSAILKAWRHAVDDDPELTAPSALPRSLFNDHIPQQLDALENRLKNGPGPESRADQSQRKEDAGGHGLQRWQQGYHLREVMKEWGHFQLCLVDVFERYCLQHADLEPDVMPMAWRALAELCSLGVSESASRYFQLQQTEAKGHVRDLELTLGQAQDLERQRGELLRQAAHDLRGHLGVVRNVTSGLVRPAIPEPTRDAFLRLLEKSVSSLHSMLDDVMNLARLQAGHEMREVKSLNAAAILHDICEHMQPMAAERGLYLKQDGPAELMVEADAVKLRRIVQNLLINSLKYTHSGGVTLCWGDSRNNDGERWMVCVQDTGPGFHAGPGAPLVSALKEATVEAREVDQAAGDGSVPQIGGETAAGALMPIDRRPIHQERGEGIGLSIVKRLCELLDASVELESKPGEGTIFRVVLPRRYEANEQLG